MRTTSDTVAAVQSTLRIALSSGLGQVRFDPWQNIPGSLYYDPSASPASSREDWMMIRETINLLGLLCPGVNVYRFEWPASGGAGCDLGA
jgi:hypothetical protein